MLAQFGPQKVFASYGAHQIMYPVAVEMGFRGTPEQLAEPATNRHYFEKKFLRDWKASGGNIRKTLLRYNGGGDPTYPDRVLNALPRPQSTLPQPRPPREVAMQHGFTGHPETDHHITELLTNRLTEADQFLQAMGYPGLTPQEQGAVAQRMAAQAHQAVLVAKSSPQSPSQSQGVTPQMPPRLLGQGAMA